LVGWWKAFVDDLKNFFPILVFTVEVKGGLYHNMFLFLFFLLLLDLGVRYYFSL